MEGHGTRKVRDGRLEEGGDKNLYAGPQFGAMPMAWVNDERAKVLIYTHTQLTVTHSKTTEVHVRFVGLALWPARTELAREESDKAERLMDG